MSLKLFQINSSEKLAKVISREGSDEFIILASDGLFSKSFGHNECIVSLRGFFERNQGNLEAALRVTLGHFLLFLILIFRV